MNGTTVELITRPYQEVTDDILTAIVGGVVREPILYDVKEDRYPLAQPAIALRSVVGTVKKGHYAFLQTIDYLFGNQANAVIWLPKGQKPDDETTFYVNYFPSAARSPLTDINVGSVTRTLAEAISREIAMVYQQINKAYQAGFVDTATDKSLDLVVSILGVIRKTGDAAEGMVTFFRDASVGDGNITIQQGTQLVASATGAIFETSTQYTLQRGQQRADVPVRASQEWTGKKGVVAAGAISMLAQPILGIKQVTNLDATVLGGQDETDDQLRARAKAAIRALGKATLAALLLAIREEGAEVDQFWDPNGIPGQLADPGNVRFLVKAEVRRFPSLQAKVNETRAAGVRAMLLAKYVYVKPHIAVTLKSPTTPAGRVKFAAQVVDAIQGYVNGLNAGAPATGQAILKAVKDLPGIGDARIMQLVAWRSDLSKAGQQALVDALVSSITSTPPVDTAALAATINQTLNDSIAVTVQRVPANGQTLGPAGQPATDTEIESGDFQVSPTVGSETWSVALDMEPGDVAFTGP